MPHGRRDHGREDARVAVRRPRAQQDARRHGYGREAMHVGLNFVFNELNLYRVCLTVFSYNESAIALYEALGFTREGVYREHLERDGRRHDMYLYGLLRSEWLEWLE